MTPVAQTILDQLGGRRFLVMTGAKNLVYSDNSLQMSLPRNKAKANKLIIKLNDLDLYDVEFGSIRGVNYTVKARTENVYNDMLVSMFEGTTGLYTKF